MKTAMQHVGEPRRDGEAWVVPSASGQGEYCVYEEWSGRLACDCDDYWYRKSRSGGQCKHIGAVRARLEETREVGAQR